jgi:acyl-CoA thioester hydrolase
MTANDFEHPVRVYWEDTDAGGVVFFANYLKFFERARTEWLRSLGFSQERMRVDEEAAFVVSETRVRYLRPARLDDLLTITVRIAAMARVSITIEQQAWRGDELLAEGSIRIACVDISRFAPRRIPDGITQVISQNPNPLTP